MSLLKAAAATVLLLSAFALLACGDDSDDDPTPPPNGDETPAPNGDETPTPDGDETPEPNGDESPSPTEFVDVCAPNPDPATPEFQVLEQPEPESEVTSPVEISGEVNYFEATYLVTLFDEDGNVIAEDFGTAMSEEIGELGPFEHSLEFDVDEATPACLWVYEESARDGSPVHVGQVPLLLQP